MSLFRIVSSGRASQESPGMFRDRFPISIYLWSLSEFTYSNLMYSLYPPAHPYAYAYRNKKIKLNRLTDKEKRGSAGYPDPTDPNPRRVRVRVRSC